MTYLSSIERIGMEIGLEKGLKKGLEKGHQKGLLDALELLLNERFGALDQAVQTRLQTADAGQLGQWAKNFVHADTIDAVFDRESA